MKLVIEIPNSIYNTIESDEVISREQLMILQKHILDGTVIPQNPTNGDVIKAIFPKYYQAIFPKYSQTMLGYLNYTRWWNTPYKEEGAE